MTDELPPLWALDMAAKAAGRTDWSHIVDVFDIKQIVYKSVVSHARTIAKHEKPPVDEAEMKRRQDAREAAALRCKTIQYDRGAREARYGDRDHDDDVQAAYFMACMKDGTTPIPVEEWGK